MNKPLPITLIAALAPNGAIGYRNQLPWHLPEDLARFKAITMGHAILMGRHTFESLPHGALPGRLNLVVSRTTTQLPDALVFDSISSVISKWDSLGIDELFVIGGESIYRQTISLASRLLLTRVDHNPAAADAFFPPINREEWTNVSTEKHDGFSFVELRRMEK
jgi:dihydrofolate reductase